MVDEARKSKRLEQTSIYGFIKHGFFSGFIKRVKPFLYCEVNTEECLYIEYDFLDYTSKVNCFKDGICIYTYNLPFTGSELLESLSSVYVYNYLSNEQRNIDCTSSYVTTDMLKCIIEREINREKMLKRLSINSM